MAKSNPVSKQLNALEGTKFSGTPLELNIAGARVIATPSSKVTEIADYTVFKDGEAIVVADQPKRVAVAGYLMVLTNT